MEDWEQVPVEVLGVVVGVDLLWRCECWVVLHEFDGWSWWKWL